jgi:hypothetical protein
MLLVAAAGMAVVPGDGAAETSPSIDVTVDGTSVADGDARLVESDPTVGVTVDANRSIREVSVRVDGTAVRRATPNATTFDDRFRVDVPSGEHALTVVVKTDHVTTHRVTVTKDAERPYVRYTAPFETDEYAPPPESASVNRTRIVLAGNFTDVTGVEHFRINRTTTYEVGSETKVDTEIVTASDLNGSFAQPLFLGVGRNEITARYYDRVGHVRVHRFEIVVEDTAPPTLSNLSAVRQSPSTLRIRGVATDNGQVRTVTVRPADGSSETGVIEPGLGRPDRTRGRVTFETQRSLHAGSTAIVIEATDTAGNAVERTVTVRRTVAPELRLDPTGTRFANASTVVVRGRATDGEIASATVETVDPASGEVVDIETVHEGGVVTDLRVERRLDAPEGRNATVRLRVIDSAGTEHVRSVDRTLTVETPAPTPTATATATATPTATATATATPATPTPTPTTGTVRPTGSGDGVGVTVPLPSVLGATVSVPIPVVGPLDVPVVPVVGLVALALGVVARVR